SSWPLFHRDDYNAALGYLKTLHSPYFVVKYYPESVILRAVLLFRLCKYAEMKRAIQFYRKEYTPYVGLLTNYLRERGGNSKVYFEDVAAYMSADEGDPGEVPGRVWDWIISDVSFQALDNRLRILNEEVNRADKVAFKF